MHFQTDRLISIRKELGISKAEAARRLNISAMAYGRYERGEREPSFQSVDYIARTFCTTTDFLYGLSDNSQPDTITISAHDNPTLFALIDACLKDHSAAQRLLAYLSAITKSEGK